MTSKFTNLPWPASGRPAGEAPPVGGADVGGDHPDGVEEGEEEETAG